ncbi:hypothetical protein [Aquabacterium sp.]|uniref:hypothetical protein n=1 Tax=Aquabacterium sp. TaxID=1872578 RepID=UPI002CE8DCB5|nr:hypothetical protein [Aquabacterium sp.]HSW03547.1 hypothetical protein [Aquabacterium sp.]
MSPPDGSRKDASRAADTLGQQAVERAILEAGAALKLNDESLGRVCAAARSEARLRHPAIAVPSAGGDDAPDSFEFGKVHAPSPGKFDPRVVQMRLSPFIASACGAVGSALGAVPVLGWAMIAVSAAIALRDFWKRKVTFDGVHGQLLFEMYRSTDSGKSHEIPVDHLFANVNASRVNVKEPPLHRVDFDLALNLLLSNGILSLKAAQGTLEWTEMAIEVGP